MAMASAQFERVATAVTEKTADLLAARTMIIDHRGLVVASSEPGWVGRTFEGDAEGTPDHQLRVPIRLNDYVGEVVVCSQTSGEVVPARLAQALIELVVNQTAAGDRLPNRRELKDRFIRDLLHGNLHDEAAILHQARQLELDLVPPRAVILIDAAGHLMQPSGRSQEVDEAKVRRRAQLLVSSIVSFFHLPTDTICSYIGEGEIAVLKASDSKNLQTWVDKEDVIPQSNASWANLTALKRAGDALLTRLRSDLGSKISLGIGRYHRGAHGLARSYQDARAALSLGLRFHGLNGVHCLDNLGVAAFVGVSDEQTKIDLATYLLSPLDQEPELLDTLEVFFGENCCPSSTAGRLTIHRNTLAYRLDKISSLTGLDPRRFDDAVQIRLSLVVRSLAKNQS